MTHDELQAAVDRLRAEADRWVRAVGLVGSTAEALRADGHAVELEGCGDALVLRLPLAGLSQFRPVAGAAAVETAKPEIPAGGSSTAPGQAPAARHVQPDFPPGGAVDPAAGASEGQEGAAEKADKAPAAPRPRAPRSRGRPGDWTDEELQTAVGILSRGGTQAEVAEAVPHRSRKSVSVKCAKLRKWIAENGMEGAAEAPPASEPAPIPATVPRAAPPRPAARPSSLGGEGGAPRAPLSARQVEAHLDALGHAAPWTPEADLALAYALVRGDGLSLAAERLGVAREEARDRWNALCPIKGLDEQQALIAALRRRATEAA
ncbi:hypothetical protein SAMN05444722_1707 [Rhodovulum sp. ES.010]|uniref:hypothetical protein n=1 Tax=Rhodovulum sp. ES.010 TaxID=1882821 RepID=UPI0009273582|nr:hypothetical protein [Rhodovulum sp. ES.010]SIO36814.1 hypothetical protein SAMN05444722_1707 [Rhodovulum sp. ES.010]